jgi:hypothetical protein
MQPVNNVRLESYEGNFKAAAIPAKLQLLYCSIAFELTVQAAQ